VRFDTGGSLPYLTYASTVLFTASLSQDPRRECQFPVTKAVFIGRRNLTGLERPNEIFLLLCLSRTASIGDQ
jgi:hypothetical protein